MTSEPIEVSEIARTAPQPREWRSQDSDDAVLSRIKHRWIGSALTTEGQRQRHTWIAHARRSGQSGSNDHWVTVEELRSLVREVLKLTESEVSDEQIVHLFLSLDTSGSSCIDYYDLVSLLEDSDVVDIPKSLAASRLKSSVPKKSKGRQQVTFRRDDGPRFDAPPWKHVGPIDYRR